jgi:hypothetical protein
MSASADDDDDGPGFIFESLSPMQHSPNDDGMTIFHDLSPGGIISGALLSEPGLLLMGLVLLFSITYNVTRSFPVACVGGFGVSCMGLAGLRRHITASAASFHDSSFAMDDIAVAQLMDIITAVFVAINLTVLFHGFLVSCMATSTPLFGPRGSLVCCGSRQKSVASSSNYARLKQDNADVGEDQESDYHTQSSDDDSDDSDKMGDDSDDEERGMSKRKNDRSSTSEQVKGNNGPPRKGGGCSFFRRCCGCLLRSLFGLLSAVGLWGSIFSMVVVLPLGKRLLCLKFGHFKFLSFPPLTKLTLFLCVFTAICLDKKISVSIAMVACMLVAQEACPQALGAIHAVTESSTAISTSASTQAANTANAAAASFGDQAAPSLDIDLEEIFESSGLMESLGAIDALTLQVRETRRGLTVLHFSFVTFGRPTID